MIRYHTLRSYLRCNAKIVDVWIGHKGTFFNKETLNIIKFNLSFNWTYARTTTVSKPQTVQICSILVTESLK